MAVLAVVIVAGPRVRLCVYRKRWCLFCGPDGHWCACRLLLYYRSHKWHKGLWTIWFWFVIQFPVLVLMFVVVNAYTSMYSCLCVFCDGLSPVRLHCACKVWSDKVIVWKRPDNRKTPSTVLVLLLALALLFKSLYLIHVMHYEIPTSITAQYGLGAL